MTLNLLNNQEMKALF